MFVFFCMVLGPRQRSLIIILFGWWCVEEESDLHVCEGFLFFDGHHILRRKLKVEVEVLIPSKSF